MPQWLNITHDLDTPARLKRVQVTTTGPIRCYVVTGNEGDLVYWTGDTPHLGPCSSERIARDLAAELYHDTVLTLRDEAPCRGATLYYQTIFKDTVVGFLPALVNPLEVRE